jgi:hypothetical protein
MNAQDKELIDEKFKGVYQYLQVEFENLNNLGQQNLEQAKKTNGRVTALEEWKEEQRIFCGVVQGEKRGVEKEASKRQTRINLVLGFCMLAIGIFGFVERRAIAQNNAALKKITPIIMQADTMLNYTKTPK